MTPSRDILLRMASSRLLMALGAACNSMSCVAATRAEYLMFEGMSNLYV